MQRNPLVRGAACWSALLVATLITPAFAVDGPAFRFTVVDANGNVVPSAHVALLVEGKVQHLFQLDKETWLVKGVGTKVGLSVTYQRLGGPVELSVPHEFAGMVDFRIQVAASGATAELLTPVKPAKDLAKQPAVPKKPELQSRLGSRLQPDRVQVGCSADDCGSANVVGGLPFNSTGNTCLCSDNYDEVCPFNTPGSPDVVYAYTPAGNETVDITLCNGSAYDTKLYVYENVCGGFQSGTAIACNDDACPGFVSELFGVNLTGGNTYYIVIDGYGGDCGDYTLDITTAAAGPANDDCGDAASISIDGSSSGTTVGSTPDGAPFCGTSNTSAGVWYSVIGDGTTLTADLCQSSFDTKLSVYCDGCTNLDCVGGNDDSCGLQSEVTWCSEVGVEYLILVHGFSSSTGDYTLEILSDGNACAAPPACGAVGPACTADFSVNAPGNFVGNTCGAGDDCGFRGSEEHIYEVTLPNDGLWTFSTCNATGNFDTFMFLSSDCCDNIIASNDDGGGGCGLLSRIGPINLTAGTYYVTIEAFGAAQCGDYELEISKEPPPPGCDGDDCATAETVPSVPFSSSGNTCDCNDNYNEVCPFTPVGAPDKVYAYTPAQDQCVDISLCGNSAYDTKLYVYENTCGPYNSGVFVACNDDACSTPSFPPAFVSRLLNVNLTGGNTYYIVIDGYDASECGDYTIDITECAPPPDCADCPVDGIPENEPNCGMPEDTTNAGCNNPIPPPGGIDCCGPNNCTDANCRAAVCACDSFCCGDWDSACAGPNPFVPGCSAQDLCAECAGGPTFNFSPIACGETYCGTSAWDPGLGIRDTDWYEVTVATDTQFTWTVEAEFDFVIGYVPTTTPGSGDCGQLIGVLDPFAVGGECEEVSVTVCVGPGTHWFFVAPLFNGAVACGAEYTATLECVDCPTGACCPGDGSCIPDVTEPQCSGDWLGEGSSCAPNPCPEPPSNDLCEDAISVGVPSVTQGSTELATTDSGFPFCGTSITSPGVWYQVTGTGNIMTASTCDAADFDTKISVYCPSCAEPTCVGGNDDAPGCAGFTSEVSWCSEVGETYLILVHGFGGQTGNFDLSVTDGASCSEPAACQRCPGNGDCCDPAGNGSPGCNDEDCCNLVCDCDSFCCDGDWDSACAGPNPFVPGCSALDLCLVCAPTGACCDGFACSLETEADCDALGGRYLGDNTTCDALPAGNPTTYSSGPLNIPIPDNDPGSPVEHTINVPDSFTLGDVNVALSIDHTWIGDICVTLTHNATTVALIQRMGTATGGCHQSGPFGCSAANIAGAVLDDQGAGGPINGQCVANLSSPPNYSPDNPLAAFNGMDSAGDWTISVTDNAGGDLGSLIEWSLILDEPGDNPCIPTGACCLWPDDCEIRSEENCEADNGVYLGDDSVCEAVGQVTVYEAVVNIPLPDGDPAGTSHTINVPDSFTIADLNVGLTIDHTWVGDLCVTLTKGATSVELIQRMGTVTGECHFEGPFGCGADNLNGILLDDAGTGGAINDQCVLNLSSPPNYVPENPLSVFNGMDAAGDWTIEVSDNAGFDTGTLIAWSLHITGPADSEPCDDAAFTGACCDRTNGSCTDDVFAEECEGAQLVWSKNLTCAEVDCEEARGACCNGLTGVCTDNVLQGNCIGEQQAWSKDTSCTAVLCEAALGACCDTLTGNCSITTQADCSADEQEWTKGAGCDDIECEPPFIPTVSAWGMIVMVLLLLVAGKVYFGYRRFAMADAR